MDFSVPMEEQKAGNDDDAKKEVLKFPTNCYCCGREGEARMCVATIPFFKEIIIMAFSCEVCGYKNTDIKNGGGISDKGTKITFKFEKEEDLSRDVFKSQTSELYIPEIDFGLASGSLGAVYTTVEGLIGKIVTHFKESNIFACGDSSDDNKFKAFLAKLESFKEGKTPFTLVLDDALSNNFIYNPHAPEDDPQIKTEVYERT